MNEGITSNCIPSLISTSFVIYFVCYLLLNLTFSHILNVLCLIVNRI